MGIPISKCYTKEHEHVRELRAKIHVLEGEIQEAKRERDYETWAYEQSVVVLACKEEEWKQERKQHKEEVARMRMRLQEDEERIRTLEGKVAAASRSGNGYFVEQIEEQARRETAVEKWKQLYHAIKTELDDLIRRTGQGERLYCEVDEGLIHGMRRELKAKDEIVEALRSRLTSVEMEGIKKEREIDILKQSLRILSNSKRNRIKRTCKEVLG